jgi:hypothetical protein
MARVAGSYPSWVILAIRLRGAVLCEISGKHPRFSNQLEWKVQYTVRTPVDFCRVEVRAPQRPGAPSGNGPQTIFWTPRGLRPHSLYHPSFPIVLLLPPSQYERYRYRTDSCTSPLRPDERVISSGSQASGPLPHGYLLTIADATAIAPSRAPPL